MKGSYEVFLAIIEESNAGWTWIPEEKGFASRDFITIKSTATGRKITCSCRIIDKYYVRNYSQHPRRSIEDPKRAIVMN